VAIQSTVHAPPLPHARRRLQPTSYIKAKLQLCTPGHAGRKRTKHVLPALQAGAKQELCFHTRRRPESAPSERGRRRPEPAPSEGGRRRLEPAPSEGMVDAPDALRRPCARRDAMHCVSTQAANSGGRHPLPSLRGAKRRGNPEHCTRAAPPPRSAQAVFCVACIRKTLALHARSHRAKAHKARPSGFASRCKAGALLPHTTQAGACAERGQGGRHARRPRRPAPPMRA
jgi:hypothetical protein